MSIQSEITRISKNVSDSLDAVEAKGVTVPSGSNSDDLPTLIAMIPSGSGGGMTVVETQDEHGGTIVTITGEEVKLQSKTATPSKSQQTISPSEGYTGLSQVLVQPIPAQYIIPEGTKTIEANGAGIDVSAYATVDVNVPSSGVELQAKTNIEPSESSQTIRPDSGYDGLSSVQINAVSSTYVGTGITRRSSTDLTASGATVTVPAGYYSKQESTDVATATHSNPTASVNSTNGLVTASHTQSAGYVSAGTTTGTLQLTTQAAKTVTPTKSSQTAVAAGRYTTGAVTVAAIPAAYQDVTGVTAAASDVVRGKSIVDSTGATVNGSLVIQHYYTGSTEPYVSVGADGDIYLMVVS